MQARGENAFAMLGAASCASMSISMRYSNNTGTLTQHNVLWPRSSLAAHPLSLELYGEPMQVRQQQVLMQPMVYPRRS